MMATVMMMRMTLVPNIPHQEKNLGLSQTIISDLSFFSA
jgi:hypothetical protein